MNDIRIGIIGSGFMGKTHAEAIRRYVTGARLVAIAGGSRAEQLARDYEVEALPSIEALITRADIDAVIITTPHAQHAGEAIAAARHGKHVLVEKPMATTLTDCDAMIDACRAAGVTLMVGQTQRFRVVNATAKRLIDEGRIGRVLMMRETQMDTGGLAGLPAWQARPENLGLLLSHGVHNLDRMRWLAGDEPALVAARCGSFRQQTATELSSMSLFTFRGGAVGSFWCEWECPKPGFPHAGSSAWIMGEAGVLDLDAYGQLRLGQGDAWTVVAEQPPIDWRGKGMLDAVRMEAYRNQNQEFIDSIRQKRRPAVAGEDGRAAVEMALAAYRSSATGQMVAFPLPRD
jgi:predicted dehydrogenase